MTLLLRSAEFLKHKTGKHPESPERLVAIESMLEKSGLGLKCDTVAWDALTEKELMQLHAPKQVEQIKQIAAHGGGKADPDTVVCPDSFKVSLFAAGACTKAVDQVLAPYLPLLQNLAVMMNDGNSMANLALLMKAQEDSANINSDQNNQTPDQRTHISEKDGSGNLENVVKSEKSEKDEETD